MIKLTYPCFELGSSRAGHLLVSLQSQCLFSDSPLCHNKQTQYLKWITLSQILRDADPFIYQSDEVKHWDTVSVVSPVMCLPGGALSENCNPFKGSSTYVSKKEVLFLVCEWVSRCCHPRLLRG